MDRLGVNKPKLVYINLITKNPHPLVNWAHIRLTFIIFFLVNVFKAIAF